jgi:hypothetical protein
MLWISDPWMSSAGKPQEIRLQSTQFSSRLHLVEAKGVIEVCRIQLIL